MKRIFTLAALAGATATTVALCLPAAAASADTLPGLGGAPVFVQTNDPTGNQIVSYLPGFNGALHQVERVNTGGDGIVFGGAVVDALASQGGLAVDRADGRLVAVNGGSNTISVFRSYGPFIGFRRVLPSGGTAPVSVAARGGLIYVLNAGGKGEVQGYYASTLTPIPGGAQSLGLTPGLTPPFLNSPGQVGFTPDGRQLVVTTKANGSDIDVLNIGQGGSLSAPVVNPSATPVPFGFTFDPFGDLVMTEAGTSALTTYVVHATGTITERASTTNGGSALCWVTGAGGFFYGANSGSNTVSGYTIAPDGTPTVVSTTATDVGPIDMASSPSGRTLYVETGGSDLLESFAVQPSGSLVFRGSVTTELPGHTGLEGIAVG
jgi:lactonase family protein with 7-bladed beta-propeller